jgi:PAS domain S-box-containing protein
MTEETNTASFNKILVVDDTTANLQFLTNLLTERGYTVYPASDGELALEFVGSILPDLILLDIRIPGMDGYEICRRLKSDTHTSSIPIIFISILEDERDKVKAFQEGGVDYITKPFQPEEILARVKNHLRLHQLTEHLEKTVSERTEELRTVNKQLQIELTERMRAEEELKSERMLLTNIMETSPIGITTVDRNGMITFANSQAVAILGLALDIVTRRTYNAPEWHITDFSGNPIPDGQLPFQQVMKTQKPVFDVQHAIVWPDGQQMFLSVNGSPLFDETGQIESVVFTLQDITERKIAEEEKLAHLRFFEYMDKINRVIQSTNDLERMMSDLLDVVLSIFNCDRAFLMYPCDPDSPTWTVPMERTKPQYPGVLTMNLDMKMDQGVAETLSILLNADGPVLFGPGTSHPLPEVVSNQFGFKCFMSMAVYPKTGSPWQFGIHQCSHDRQWTEVEIRIFREIGRRLSDALTSLLSYQSLQQSEERYRLVFENSPVSIWEEDFSDVKKFFNTLRKEGIIDLEGYLTQYPEVLLDCAGMIKIIDVNRSALMLHRATSKQELMAGIVNAFTPESFDTFKQELVCLWSGNTKMTADAVVKTLTGDLRKVTISFSVCPGSEESYSKILVSITDITERVQAEEALRNSEAALREAQRLGRLGSWDWDIASDAITCSQEFYHIYGFDPTKPPPGYIQHLRAYTPESAALLDAAVKKNIETGESYVLDLELANKNSPSHWITARSETKYGPQGKIIGLRGTAQDITERKLAEEEIRRFNRELENRVLERTAELQATNRELESFSYSVSHDLRAPLRHIDGFLGLLQKRLASYLDEQSGHYMTAISESARRMGILIDDILSFSRMGRIEMSKMQINLAALIDEVIHELEPDFTKRIIQWHIAKLPVVTGDRALLRTVLINLISNAIKFTRPREQAEIEIGYTISPTENIIFVRDNGVGYDHNYEEKLFNVFQRLHTTDEFEGTGVGLANVRRIINRHGGRTWAEGKVNYGAVFYFSLPVSKQP